MTYEIFFEENIGKYLKNVLILKHETHLDNHEYVPYTHDFRANCEEELADLIKKYIFMYAYSQTEVLEANSKNRLTDLSVASIRALRERLPERTGPTNGLWGELIMHLLFELDDDGSERLATRTIYRQKTDNQEIKGFDGMQIKFKDNHTELWLGQSKMGAKRYTFSSIKEDLNGKTDILYTSEQLYFIADKETKVSTKALEFLNRINDISWGSEGKTQEERAQLLEQFFIKEKVQLVFPCILAYDSEETYESIDNLPEKIEKEIASAVKSFKEEFDDLFENVNYQVLIWLFPLRDLNRLRSFLTI